MDNYNNIYDITCRMLTVFNGKQGKHIVQEVNEMMNKSPSLRKFMFDFYYNVRAATKEEEVDNESKMV